MTVKNKIKKYINWILSKPKTIIYLVFITLLFIVCSDILEQYRIEKNRKHFEMNNTLEVIHKNIEQSLNNAYGSVLTLTLSINDNGIPENFDSIAKQVISSDNSIAIVKLIPEGVIRHIYPLKGNESEIGLNILASKVHQTAALKSIKNRKIYFEGPFKLTGGELGIAGRLPVYKKNKFWGFSVVVIQLENLLKNSGINSIDPSKYQFQFSRRNPITSKEDFFLPMEEDLSKNNFISTIIPYSNWTLYLIDKNPNSLYASLITDCLLGFVLAALFGILTIIILKKTTELKLLVNRQKTSLLKKEKKFKAIFDQAAVGIAYIDSYSGQFIEVNEKYCKLLEYSAEELKQMGIQSIIHPADLKKSLLHLEKLYNGEIREYSMEKKYLSKSGNTIWVNITVSPLWKVNESPTNHIVIMENITKRKNIEKLANHNESRFKTLFDHSPVGLWEKDYSEVKKYLSDLNLINKSPEEVTLFLKNNPGALKKCLSLIKIIDVNNQCLIQYAPKTKSELIENIDIFFGKESVFSFPKLLVAICTGVHYLKLDIKIKNPKGEIRDMHLIYRTINGYEDTLKRVIITTDDITERKSAEKTILNSQQKIESLINTIDGIVWEYDAETLKFNFISKKVEDILGYSAEEWLGNPTFWEDHLHPEDKDITLKYCAEQNNLNLNYDFEYRMIAKNGDTVWFRDIVNVIVENDKATSLRGIMIDITKNKEIEKDLNDSFNLASEQNKRLLNFSYIVSHNLRSHTSNILSIVDLIETSESEEEKEEMIQLLKSVSDSLNETMLNLNEVVNIQTNVGLVTEDVNLKQYLDNTLNVLSDQIEMKGVNVISSIKKDIEVNYSPAYLESILYNLISNAVRYSHSERNPTITIDYYVEKNMKVLQVSDNGIGIDLNKNGHKIFGMYKKFSNHKDSKGIGLFITKNQIDAMGGNITVESELNRGTTFKIYIA